MEQLPVYVYGVFIGGVLLTLLLLYKATAWSRPVIITTLAWLALQAIAGLSGFYRVTAATPPRIVLLLAPPILAIIILFVTKKGKKTLDGLDVKTLTLLHIVRIPVELTLYWLFLHKAVPRIMTFEGRNFDIVCGLTAPFIYYFGYIKNSLGRTVLMIWNMACLLLLANIVITAILSAPSPIQKLAFDQPNIALFYFPFVWLPCFLVPTVLLAHLAAMRRLIKAH